MTTYMRLVEQTLKEGVPEILPWDLEERLEQGATLLLLDIREECEYMAYHIRHSMLVPRGILETACEAEYEDAVPELIAAREREIIVICRSGNRSVLAAQTMHWMGYRNVASMKTGLRGWNDYELPLVNRSLQIVDPDDVEELLNAGFCSTLMHPDRRTIQS